MKRSPLYIAALIAALLVGSWAISGTVGRIMRPQSSGNAEAYAELCVSAKSGLYAEIERGAANAYSNATDPDLRKMSDFLLRHAKLAQRAEVTTTHEANSFSGLGKNIFTSFQNPMHGVESLTMSAELLMTDFKALGTRLDERYQPILERNRFAETCATAVWWVCIIGGTLAYLFLRNRFKPLRLKALQREPVLSE